MSLVSLIILLAASLDKIGDNHETVFLCRTLLDTFSFQLNIALREHNLTATRLYLLDKLFRIFECHDFFLKRIPINGTLRTVVGIIEAPETSFSASN